MSREPDIDDEADTCVIDAYDDLSDTQDIEEGDPGREQATTDIAHEAIALPAAAPAVRPAPSASARLRPRRTASIRRTRRRSSSISVQGVAVIMLGALAVLAMIVATRLF